MARDLAEVVDFGRYEPLFRIGLGGMAEVYAARIRGEAGFQKLVAVKRMLPHLTGDQKFVDMFLDEARLAANISSPHVVQTLDLGRAADDSLYIVMNLVLGVTISEILRHLATEKKFVDTGIAVELITQAAQGLDDAHEAVTPGGEPLSLVHRDISPQNILVGMDGRARVTDFGIAHALLLRRTETQVGELKGKFAYFSPEQAMGKTLDRRSDIFALGIVAWELITGRRLFKGTPLQQLEAVKRCEITAPAELRRDLPQALSDAVMGALAPSPDDRYASAAAFASALRRVGGSFEDIPGPRVIGRFATEVGGERVQRIRKCISNSGKLPSDVKTVTAIIEGTVSGTLFLEDGEDGEESTHILDDEVSEVQSAATARGMATPATREESVHTAEAELATHVLGTDDLGPEVSGATSETTSVKVIAEQPTLTLPSDGAPTETSAPPDISEASPLPDQADVHQAPTGEWILSAGAAPEAQRSGLVFPMAAIALVLLVLSGGALAFAIFGGAGEQAGDTSDDGPNSAARSTAAGSPAPVGGGPAAQGAVGSAGDDEQPPPPADGERIAGNAGAEGPGAPATGDPPEGQVDGEDHEDEVSAPPPEPRTAAMDRTMRRGRSGSGGRNTGSTMAGDTDTGGSMTSSPIPGWRP